MTALLTQTYNSNSVLSGLDNATIVYTRALLALFYEILVIKRKQKPRALTNPFIRTIVIE